MSEISIPCDDAPVDFEIAYIAKAKHADLYRAAKKMGGQAALARHLGVHQSLLGEWCNLQRMPQFRTGRFTDPVLLADFEQKLFDLTHKTLDELFPPELRDNQEFLKQPKTKEFYATVDLKMLAISSANHLSLPSASSIVEENERRSLVGPAIRKALSKLPSRLRSVVEMRYGLKDGKPMKLEDIGKEIGVCKQRVGELERTAIRKLGLHSSGLVEDDLLP